MESPSLYSLSHAFYYSSSLSCNSVMYTHTTPQPALIYMQEW